jgi:hypothetical protein
MSSLATKQIVGKILDVEVDTNWNVINQVGNLALAHIRHEPDPEVVDILSFMRGVVVDVNAGTIVCRSNGKDNIVVSDSIQEKDNFYIVDTPGTQGGSLKCLKYSTKLYRSVDGVVIRTFYHQGKVYFSNFTKIDIVKTKARLTSSKTFYEIYTQGHGPKEFELYDKNKMFSPWVHVFVVSDPDVLNVSKIPLSSSLVVYLNSYCMWEDSPYDGVYDGEIDWENRINNIDFETDFSKIGDESPKKPMKLLPMDLESANKFLRCGYSSDNYNKNNPKLGHGECIIMSVVSDNDVIPNIFRVHSLAYEHRTSLKQSQPNLFLRFLQLSNYAKWSLRNEIQIQRFVQAFPRVRESSGKIVSDPKRSLMSFDDRLENIWLNFKLAVPLSKSKTVSTYMEDFKKAQKDVVNLINTIHLESQFDPKKHPFVLKRTLNEIRQETRYNKSILKKVIWKKVRLMPGIHLHQCLKVVKRGFFKLEKKT